MSDIIKQIIDNIIETTRTRRAGIYRDRMEDHTHCMIMADQIIVTVKLFDEEDIPEAEQCPPLPKMARQEILNVLDTDGDIGIYARYDGKITRMYVNAKEFSGHYLFEDKEESAEDDTSVNETDIDNHIWESDSFDEDPVTRTDNDSEQPDPKDLDFVDERIIAFLDRLEEEMQDAGNDEAPRRGCKWSDGEDMFLITCLFNKYGIGDIADALGRTKRGVRERLKELFRTSYPDEERLGLALQAYQS